MKPASIDFVRWWAVLALVATSGVVFSQARPFFPFSMGFCVALILSIHRVAGSRSGPSGPRLWSYRFRNPDAGRWLEAPVAELDKSTVGKLLASRASRDPSVHAVVGGSKSPDRSDTLYDPEIDG